MPPPLYSAFTDYGFLEYSSEPSDAEKIYEAACAGYVDPKTGTPAVDLSEGTYHEAKLYARALAIADAKATVARSANQEDPLLAVESLPHHERTLRLTPRSSDTLDQRRAVAARRRKRPRGSRYEALNAELSRILGSALVAIRPVAPHEATVWPDDPGAGPGVFVRPDEPAKVVRLLDPITTIRRPADAYSDAHVNANAALVNTAGANVSAVGQSFTGNGRQLVSCRVRLQKVGAPAGTAVAHVFAHAGVFGTSSVPTGAPLASSAPFNVATLTAAYATIAFTFPNPIALDAATSYVLVIAYESGTPGNFVQVGIDLNAASHPGNLVYFAAGAWAADAGIDMPFAVDTLTDSEVAYANWDASQPDVQLVKGDVLSVQPENPGLAEKVTVLSVAGAGASRTLTACFTKVHDRGASASTGPVPMGWSTLGHMFVVVSHEAALDAERVAAVDEYLTRTLKGGATWSVVEPSAPGAATIGPFALGLSPLGVVPLASMPITPLRPPTLGVCVPARGTTGGGTFVRIYGRDFSDATGVRVGGASVPFTVVSDYELTFTTRSHVAGTFDLEVVTPLGASTKPQAFTFVQAPLSITSLTPKSGPLAGGTLCTLVGTGFYAVTDVVVGWANLAAPYVIVDDNTLTFVTDPRMPGVLPVDVTTATGSASTLFTFTP